MANRKAESNTLAEKYAKLERQLQHKEKELYSIQRIGKALSSTLDLDELLKLIMQEITVLMDADRSTLYIVDHEEEEIWSKIALKAEVKEIRQKLGKGISGHVAATGESINIPDAYKDDRFDPTTDKKTGYQTRSILCMPVYEPLSQKEDREIIAVLQVLNKRDGYFSGEDEALLESLASQVAISIANARLYQQLDKKFKEVDLLYDFEQLLSSVYEIRQMLEKLLIKTVDHLQAKWVLGFFPVSGQYVFVGTNDKHENFFSTTSSVSLGWMDFVQRPTRNALNENWNMVEDYFRITEKPDFDEDVILHADIDIDPDNRGILLALEVKSGESKHYEDERKLLNLVGQKISRAQELHNLRETLLKRERLSAIGQLMSTIVHDIRSPVNTIHGFVDLMEDETTSAEERNEYGGIIRDEINSTMNMITEVLDFAKGKTNILPRKSSVKNIVKRFKPRLQQMCQRNKTDLSLDIQSNELVYADEEKLSRVFYNVTKNALEAMDEGGKIQFKVFDDGDMITFQFTDNGPGIPREIQDRLFESFVTSGKAGGTGLGLAIVKKIIEEHHGEIEIDSREGEGATFRIILPVHKKN